MEPYVFIIVRKHVELFERHVNVFLMKNDMFLRLVGFQKVKWIPKEIFNSISSIGKTE